MIRTSIKRAIIYPAAILTDNISVTIDILVFYFIWTAVYDGQNMFEGITYAQMITYIIMARLLYHLFAWGMNAEISRIIQNGDITVELIKPIRFWITKISC